MTSNNQMAMFRFWNFGECGILFMSIIPRFTRIRLLEPVRASLVGQIELFILLQGIILSLKYNY